jgi:hydrogenase nickel incorporation protein HypA/HybF
MHEFSIAQNIVRIAVDAARKEKAQKITRVHVIAGELRGIIPVQLTFYFGLASENTIAEGAQLEVEIVPAKGKCRACDTEFTIKDYSYVCPSCAGINIETVGGTELRLTQIEAE